MPALRVLLLIPVFLIQSCAQGFIYTHTTMPLTTNMQNTPIGVEKQEGSTKQVSFQVQARWDTNGLGEIAKQHFVLNAGVVRFSALYAEEGTPVKSGMRWDVYSVTKNLEGKRQHFNGKAVALSPFRFST